jgi:hypothetical protein
MIDGVHLANFKAFQDVRLPCRAFTLLTGLNGVGKSSLIQSLLLLRQSHQSGDLAQGVAHAEDDIRNGLAESPWAACATGNRSRQWRRSRSPQPEDPWCADGRGDIPSGETAR